MKSDLICEWLSLPTGSWPPDHYRLLGLAPGESDARLIEQRVQQRLESVRRYQMMHPEPATEAMNRLAQAYVCLTEPTSKQAYDATLLGDAAPAATAVAEPAQTLTPAPDALAWLFGPALTRSRSSSSTPPPQARLAPLAPPTPLQPQPVESAEVVDPIIAAAQQSAPARRGLGTKRALYKRVLATRQFVTVWEELGKYVESPTRRISRSADGPELNRLFNEVVQLQRRFPRLIGAAGQPGYLVVTFSEQDDAVKSIRALDEGQRKSLSRDWSTGWKLLTAHRDFLRQEIRTMRKRTLKERMILAVRALIADWPGTICVLLVLLALAVAVWNYLSH